METKVTSFALAFALAVSLFGCSSPRSRELTEPVGKRLSDTGANEAAPGREGRGTPSSLRESFTILSGSLAWARRDWASAAKAFLDAEESALASGNETLRQYAVYGLAATYLAEDEYESAVARLAELDAGLSPELGSGLWYQAGIVAFRKGEYADAVAMFRKSLERDGERADAKINLELSARSLSESDSKRSAGGSGFAEAKPSESDEDAIFDLVRRKERDRWKNQEEEASREIVADY